MSAMGVCMHVGVCLCVCTRMHAYMHVCMHVCEHVHTCMSVCVCSPACMCVLCWCVFVCVCSNKQGCQEKLRGGQNPSHTFSRCLAGSNFVTG